MRADFLPEHVERLLHWVDASPQGGLSRGGIFTAWRQWQLGRPCWREPAYEPPLVGQWGPGERSGTGWAALP
ncbi:unnamed protein product, partial [Effrenium voratum]